MKKLIRLFNFTYNMLFVGETPIFGQVNDHNIIYLSMKRLVKILFLEHKTFFIQSERQNLRMKLYHQR